MNYSLPDKLSERDLAPIIKQFFDQNDVCYKTKRSNQSLMTSSFIYDVIITKRKWTNRRERRENKILTESEGKIDLRGEIRVEISRSKQFESSGCNASIYFQTNDTDRTIALSFLHYMIKSLPQAAPKEA